MWKTIQVWPDDCGSCVFLYNCGLGKQWDCDWYPSVICSVLSHWSTVSGGQPSALWYEARWVRLCFPYIACVLIFMDACVCACQVHLLQLAEILVFLWMAVAMGKAGSLVIRWPSLVIQVMNCRGRAESPASKWKIDTTGNPALQAALVRKREIVETIERRGYVEETESGKCRWSVYFFLNFLSPKLLISPSDALKKCVG